MHWGHRMSLFQFPIIHRAGRTHQVPDNVSLLRRDTEPNFPSNVNDIPNLENGTVLAGRTHSRTSKNAIALESNENQGNSSNVELDDLVDEDDVQLDAIDLYQAVYL